MSCAARVHDFHRQPRLVDDCLRGFGFFGDRIAEHDFEIGAHDGQHRAGHAAAGADVEHPIAGVEKRLERQAVDNVARDEFFIVGMSRQVQLLVPTPQRATVAVQKLDLFIGQFNPMPRKRGAESIRGSIVHGASSKKHAGVNDRGNRRRVDSSRAGASPQPPTPSSDCQYTPRQTTFSRPIASERNEVAVSDRAACGLQLWPTARGRDCQIDTTRFPEELGLNTQVLPPLANARNGPEFESWHSLCF